MTAMREWKAPCRRQGELGVHSLDSFGLVAPDVSAAADFYADFGLDVAASGNIADLRVAGHTHVQGRVAPGPKKKLDYIAFGAFADDMPRFADHLAKVGVDRAAAPAGFADNGLWFRDPDGLLVGVIAAERTSPEEKAAFASSESGPNERGAHPRGDTPIARPKRFSHMAIYARDVEKSVAFYSRAMGMRLADRAADIIAFCHGIHGSDHHMVAFVKSGGPGLHHSSWDMGSVDGIGLGAMQMGGAGHKRGWGLGRHVLGSNYFHYVRDPWGSFAEYTAGMDYVPHDRDWDAGVHAAEDSFYLWANDPPEDFARNFEIE